ncbi:hypothetical protein CC1G_07904 [Coprinopsis cinerea okayama7|uniref:Uncharacterized protein n=1 Tax=Coprinopsis cinerea (strain Okayama-7 / 130 / ATCC MYA-4618 / FGSC 9003) TaxID=240176 RepID=A8P6M9_COPC7|nr:hypothetical protein CC1G_07904 [Coprinopsis cinerea okayama7\|eukprot:XP_001839189.2 hypothetical protein CC1G_07904 [Coprinopsis cinerea okayama7\
MSKLKIAYFVTRYSIFVYYMLIFIYSESRTLTIPQCYRLFVSSVVSIVVNSACSDALLYLQVYAFSGKNKIIGSYLALQFLAAYAIKFGLLSRYFKVIVFAKLNLPGLYCTPINPLEVAPYMAGVFVVPIPAITILIAITFWIHRSSYRGLHSSLLVVLVRNGMIYVLVILLLTIITVIVNYAHGSNSLVSIFQGAVHPLLSTRLILHLREQAHREAESSMANAASPLGGKHAGKLGSLKFAAPPIQSGSETSTAGVSTMEMSDMTHRV